MYAFILYFAHLFTVAGGLISALSSSPWKTRFWTALERTSGLGRPTKTPNTNLDPRRQCWETIAVTPLIKALKQQHPELSIVLTTTTRTGADQTARLGDWWNIATRHWTIPLR